MNAYEEKIEARRERLTARATRAARAASTASAAAHRTMSGIPMGQPILVGHHSEARHRRDVARIDSNLRRAHAATQEAADLSRRAEAVGSGGVSSDDPDAIVKLRAEVERAKARQALMVAGNRALKAKDPVAALAALGLPAALLKPDCMGNVGFARYQLTNNGANIRRMEARIAELEARAMEVTTEREVAGVRIVDDVETNRLRLVFETAPDADTRARLKANGFRWSPRAGSWQRHRGAGAIAAADRLFRQGAAS